jgi:tRNA nucleotidyltransferase (CCA-adding enzyme)
MALMKDILKEVLKEITPTQEELTLINEIVKKLRKLLNEKAQQLNLKYTKI